jgi:hypothetical protein
MLHPEPPGRADRVEADTAVVHADDEGVSVAGDLDGGCSHAGVPADVAEDLLQRGREGSLDVVGQSRRQGHRPGDLYTQARAHLVQGS